MMISDDEEENKEDAEDRKMTNEELEQAKDEDADVAMETELDNNNNNNGKGWQKEIV